MQRVVLKEIELEGFKSFVASTKIVFSAAGGFKFLGGDNIAEPRLGANGAGKTSLWDGLVWVLYGTSIKGLKASELVSWGQKRPSGSVLLEIDDVAYRISRLGNPDSLSVDGEKTDQKGLNALLRLSRQRFLHSVIFGQGVPFFVDLPVAERSLLLDEVLDLQVWLKASEQASKAASTLRLSIAAEVKAAAYQEGKLAGLPSIEGLKTNALTWEIAQAGLLEDAIVKVEEAEASLIMLQSKQQDTERALAQVDADEIAKATRTSQTLQSRTLALTMEYRSLHEKCLASQSWLDYLIEHANCPTCRQKYPTAERNRNKDEALASLADLKFKIQKNGSENNAIAKLLQETVSDLDKLTRKRDFLAEQVKNAAGACNRQLGAIEAFCQQAEQVGELTENPYAAQLAQVAADQLKIASTIEAMRAARLEQEGKLALADYWISGFKRVRLFMVRRILTHLELEVSNAAELLGLIGWRIEFVTETETKSGSLKQGVQIQITSPKATAAWESWSGGEGQRIRLAIGLGFAAMVQRIGGVSFAFEVWDEPSAWLSPEGIEDLLGCLKYRAELTQKSVWLLDHRALIHSGFSEIWKVSKDAKGSRVELMA